MKKIALYLLLVITFILLFINCEKENTFEPIQNIEKESTYNVKTVNLSEIPLIRDFLLDKTNDNLFKSTEIDGAIFDDDNIMEVIDTLNNTNYSFKFVYPNTPVGTFYNLVVGKTPEGENKTPYVLKYVCNDVSLDAFIDSNFNFGSFKGTMSIHKYSDFFELGSILKIDPNCSPNYDENGDPIPCDTTGIDGSSTGSSGGGGDETNDTGGSNDTSYNSTGDPNPGPDGSDSGSSSTSDSGSDGSSGGSGASPCVSSECYPSWDDCQEYIVVINPDCLNNDGQIAPSDDNNISSKAGEDCPECPTGSDGGVGVLTNNNTWTIETEIFTTIGGTEITNIDDYLKCFDESLGATVTVYVDQPTANSNATWSGSTNSPEVGHTFISISQGGITRTLGYYPEGGIKPMISNSAPGILVDDSEHPYDVSISRSLTPGQLTSLLISIKNPIATYNLDNNNCSDFSLSLANSRGFNLPDTQGTWPGGGGTNPGNLGQDIRAMSSTSGSTIDASGGDAPLNSGTCP